MVVSNEGPKFFNFFLNKIVCFPQNDLIKIS